MKPFQFTYCPPGAEDIELRTVTKSKLVEWVNTTEEGKSAFLHHVGPGRTVEDYLREYIHRNGIVQDLASDLNYPGNDFFK